MEASFLGVGLDLQRKVNDFSHSRSRSSNHKALPSTLVPVSSIAASVNWLVAGIESVCGTGVGALLGKAQQAAA